MSIIPYELMRNLLFRLDAEKSHDVALHAMKWAERLSMSGLYRSAQPLHAPVDVMGLSFRNPVGLAAGLDKNGDYIDALGDLGFGFIEVGTVTPRPQPGNPRPRLFRLPQHEAIINRMGFNNKGVDYLVNRVNARSYKGILGINIGKNFDTPVEEAVRDYICGMEKVYSVADYIVVNFSSPNTPGLRNLQTGDLLEKLVRALAEKRSSLEKVYGKNVPLLLKIAPDMSDPEIDHLVITAIQYEISGIIATNTTVSRQGVEDSDIASQAGGLSGRPLLQKSTSVLSSLNQKAGKKMALIGVGGITDSISAVEKFQAGADLVQIYTGFIYRGPDLIKEICCQIGSDRQ